MHILYDDMSSGSWGGRGNDSAGSAITVNQTWQSECTPSTPTRSDLMRYNQRTDWWRYAHRNTKSIHFSELPCLGDDQGKWWQWRWLTLWDEAGRRDAPHADYSISKKSPQRVGDCDECPYNGRLTDETDKSTHFSKYLTFSGFDDARLIEPKLKNLNVKQYISINNLAGDL